MNINLNKLIREQCGTARIIFTNTSRDEDLISQINDLPSPKTDRNDFMDSMVYLHQAMKNMEDNNNGKDD